MRNVQQVANELGVTRPTVYKYLSELNLQTTKQRNQAMISDEDFNRIKQSITIKSNPEIKETNYKDDYINSLNDRINSLENQLKSKDEQIEKLIQTNTNFQVLIKNKDEKILELQSSSSSEKPKTFFQRLFNF